MNWSRKLMHLLLVGTLLMLAGVARAQEGTLIYSVDFEGDPDELPAGLLYETSLGVLPSITMLPGEVISGNYSLRADGTVIQSEWKQFLYTDPDVVPLRAGGTYRIELDYRILSHSPDQLFYVIFRTVEGGNILDKTGPFFPVVEGVQHYSAVVTLADFDDYRLVFGMRWPGLIIIDNIAIYALD